MKKKTLGSFIMAGMILTGCNVLGGKDSIQSGSQVKMHYTLKVDGKMLQTSKGQEPLPIVQGRGDILPSLDEQLLGLKTGDKKEIVLSPEKGYGTRKPNSSQQVPLSSFGENAKKLKPGMVVGGSDGKRQFQATILTVGPKEVTLDLNHPLAGKTLNFSVEIIEVVQPG